MAEQKIEIGTKFKVANDFHNIHEIISLNEKANTATVKVTNAKEKTKIEHKWRIDDIIYFFEIGDYEIINERPDVNKHDQLENCGSHSD